MKRFNEAIEKKYEKKYAKLNKVLQTKLGMNMEQLKIDLYPKIEKQVLEDI